MFLGQRVQQGLDHQADDRQAHLNPHQHEQDDPANREPDKKRRVLQFVQFRFGFVVVLISVGSCHRPGPRGRWRLAAPCGCDGRQPARSRSEPQATKTQTAETQGRQRKWTRDPWPGFHANSDSIGSPFRTSVTGRPTLVWNSVFGSIPVLRKNERPGHPARTRHHWEHWRSHRKLPPRDLPGYLHRPQRAHGPRPVIPSSSAIDARCPGPKIAGDEQGSRIQPPAFTEPTEQGRETTIEGRQQGAELREIVRMCVEIELGRPQADRDKVDARLDQSTGQQQCLPNSCLPNRSLSETFSFDRSNAVGYGAN
ncbi:MAG: hypothetical protein Ct9H300mP1_03060 [Planctomycetaceae bacterium]|nr:MAG: hypothetical protein Ct9H300mP1_03060 [Planctomycetaceae bacterium]